MASETELQTVPLSSEAELFEVPFANFEQTLAKSGD
jgi:hypothetical protein